jgi:dTDP-4-dehydrorhamnose reductase
MRVLVLGATGMLGRALCQVLGSDPRYEVVATTRGVGLGAPGAQDTIGGIDVLNGDDLARAFARARPDAVINAVGLIKQLKALADDPLNALPINSLLPHRLAQLAQVAGARLVHVSTDCVFTGARGGYREEDPTDAQDLYGLSKRLGEVTDDRGAITLRTSIIGRENGSANGLVEWFLHAGPQARGWRRAVFSGLPTVVLAQVIADHVLPDADLFGLYHVSAEPIDKFTLLQEVARAYGRATALDPMDDPVIDRSLNSDRFRAATGWSPPPWPALIDRMKALQP